MKLHLSLFLLAASALLPVCLAGRHNKHGGGNRLMELLTAGIVAKVLQKDDSHGGGGGGGGYYTVPIPVSMGHGHQQKSHSHVTEKIIPIPIPHHTTRIIHINAGHEGGEGGFDSHGGGGGGFDSHGGGGGGFDIHGGGGGGGYDSHSGGEGGYDSHHHHTSHGSGHAGSADHHHEDRHHPRSPTIQQLLFHDGGVYGAPQPPRSPYSPAVMRRPVVGMVPHAPAPMGMMPPAYPAVSAAHLYPTIASGHYHPAMASAQFHPALASSHLHPSLASSHLYPSLSSASLNQAVAATNPQMVRVRHYYALPSARHRMLAYPSASQSRYQQLLMMQRRPPRLW